MTHLKPVLLLGLVTLSVAGAQGTAVTPIKTTASTFVVNQKTENGKTTETLTDGSKALPGQTLEMRQNVQNLSKTNYGKGAVIQAISAGTAYQSNRCDLPGVTASFSTDRVQFDPKSRSLVNSQNIHFSEKPTKTVTVKENGVDVKKVVLASSEDYTALRWNLPGLKAGASINCMMRVKVK